jgi:hypothetical protein
MSDKCLAKLLHTLSVNNVQAIAPGNSKAAQEATQEQHETELQMETADPMEYDISMPKDQRRCHVP